MQQDSQEQAVAHEQELWDWLVVGTSAADSPQGGETTLDDLDFLDDVPAPPAAPLPLRPAESDRWQQCEQRPVTDGLIARLLHEQGDLRLADLDEAAAHWTLQALAPHVAGRLVERGGLARLVQRALLSAHPALVAEACKLAAAAPLPHLQPELVAALQRLVQTSAAAQWIDGALQALEQVGDGRCVRPMEALLAEHPAGWTEYQAWRARHIVQVIRRGGRR